MTFEEAFDKICEKESINRYGDYAADIIDNCRMSYGSGVASRDAEVAELREQVTLLRNVLHFANAELRVWYEELMGVDYNSVEITEALAATEPK